MIVKVKHYSLHLIHQVIARFWVQPLEDQIIPHLRKKNGWLPRRLIQWASWWANAGRVIVTEARPLKIRWIGPDWSLTYLGTGESSEILCHHLFSSPPQETERERVFLWQVPALVRRHTAEGDLVVCELNQIIHMSPTGMELSFTVPQLVKQGIENFDRPLDAIIADFQPDIRKRIRRLDSQGFSSEISNCDADFDLFYHRMYLPYIQGRHGGLSATICEYDYLHEFFKEGVLVLIKKDGSPVAGGVLQHNGDTSRALHMGVLDGDYELVKQGSNVSLWWAGLQWAHQQGTSRFILGTSFPIAANGVFTFKRHWGSHVYPDDNTCVKWSFFGKNLPNQLREQFNRQGFLTEVAGNHYQVLLHDPTEPLDQRKIANQLYDLSRSGISGIVKISRNGERQLIPAEAVEQDPTGQRYLANLQFAVLEVN